MRDSTPVKPIGYPKENAALLRLLALSAREVEEGKVTPVAGAVERIRARRRHGG